MGFISRLPFWQHFAWRAYNYVLLRTGVQCYPARTYFGALIDCDPRDLVQRMILYFGKWEPEVGCLIEQRLRPGAVFIDIGANIGYDTLLASACVGAEGRVIAIEASPAIFGMLSKNLARNSVKNVEALNFAVTDKPCHLPIYAGPETNIGMTTTKAERGFKQIAEVEGAPLEMLIEHETLKRVKLIKIDVEGTEAQILSHFLSTLELYPPDVELLVELAPATTEREWICFDELLSSFRQRGFHCYSVANEYDVRWYFAWKGPAKPVEITTYPRSQIDVLLSRNQL